MVLIGTVSLPVIPIWQLNQWPQRYVDQLKPDLPDATSTFDIEAIPKYPLLK
jgi:hypothetical protein